MSVSFSEIMEVKNFLMQQYIAVSQEWTEACIAFVKQEQGRTMSLDNIKKSVYQQWLVADLEEIVCSSLPQQLPTVQKITLNKNFALQVQGIRDISKPAYSQLKQLEGTVNSNAEFTSAPKVTLPEWEAKPSRMLMLNLTDGCTHVQGMEYKTISFLSPNLHPGIKVLIKGPIDCRFGVLLLTKDNIKILGGEVESKLLQYSRETLLREQLQIPIEDQNQGESATTNSGRINSNQESSNINMESVHRTSHLNSYQSDMPRNERFPRNQRQTSMPAQNVVNSREGAADILDHFESDDDDFVHNIDYGMIDEIENSQRPINEVNAPGALDDEYIWHEDEDVVRDMMEFQDRNPDFEMPFQLPDEPNAIDRTLTDGETKEVFSYLSSVINNSSTDCVITIKGFIITVLSKLECTPSTGWSLIVKINDGTASLDANIHDKVLEDIMGISAQDMMKKKVLAAQNLEIKREVMEALSKCKLALQNYNCLMDIKFSPGDQPCIVKCSPVSQLHLQQLLERVRSSF